MKKVDLYIRVSTDEPAHLNNSIEKQERDLIEYCQKNEFKIRKVFHENCPGNTFDRPEWRKILAEYCCPPPPVDAILFHSWDRFCRNPRNGFLMLNNLRQVGVEARAISTSQERSQAIKDFMQVFLLNLNNINKN